MTSRRVHYVKVKLYEGSVASVTWSPERQEHSDRIRLAVEELKNAMKEHFGPQAADPQTANEEEG